MFVQLVMLPLVMIPVVMPRVVPLVLSLLAAARLLATIVTKCVAA